MSESVADGKRCIHCGGDCSGKPRVKDAQGRYACKTCFEAARAAQAAGAKPVTAAPASRAKPAPAPAAAAVDDDAAMMAALFDSPGPAAAGPRACPSCGGPMPAEAAVCMHCGYNEATGKGTRIKIKRETGAGAAAGKVGRALILANPLVWAVGGLIGGGLGAVVWAVVAVSLNREIGWIAWGVGVATGLGVRVLAGRYAGVLSGLIAAVIAVVAVLGGKFASASIVVEQFAKESTPAVQGAPAPVSKSDREFTVTDDDLRLQMAFESARKMDEAGLKLYWPQGKNFDNAEMLYDFPPDVRDEVSRAWRKATPQWKEERRAAARARLAEFDQKLHEIVAQNQDMATQAVFEGSFGLLDVVFFLLAVASAFSVGSGAGIGGGGGED